MSQYLALVKPTARAYGAGRMDTRRGGGAPGRWGSQKGQFSYLRTTTENLPNRARGL